MDEDARGAAGAVPEGGLATCSTSLARFKRRFTRSSFASSASARRSGADRFRSSGFGTSAAAFPLAVAVRAPDRAAYAFKVSDAHLEHGRVTAPVASCDG